MKELMQDRRRRLPALAVMTALVLTFAVPPLARVVAQSSSSSFSSPPGSCDSSTNLGSAAPGQTVSGDLGAGPGDCGFAQDSQVTVTLDGGSLQKTPNANGNVHVSVKVNSTSKGTLDDPVDVTLQCGTNTVTATGTTESDVTATATGTFTVVCALPPGGITGASSAPIIPISGQAGGGLARTGMNILALLLLAAVAIAMGLYTIASERAIPVAATTAASMSEPVPTMAVPTVSLPTMPLPTLSMPALSLGGRWRGAARLARQFKRYG